MTIVCAFPTDLGRCWQAPWAGEVVGNYQHGLGYPDTGACICQDKGASHRRQAAHWYL